MRLEPVEGPSLLPTALRDVNSEVRATWVALTGAVSNPMARARLYDIVFVLRMMPNNRRAAEHAARAYLDGVGGRQDDQAQANGVVRAWSLARSVRFTALEQEITGLMVGLTGDLLDRRAHPYAVIPLLCALIAPARDATVASDPRVDDVLDRAMSAYSRPHVLKDVVVVVRKRAAGDAARVDAADRRLVEAMLDDAPATTEPIVLRARLNEAASPARQRGLPDLEKAAVAALQAAPAVEWTTMTHEFTLTAEQFDDYLPGFTTARDWRAALRIWLHTEPPTGSYKFNQAVTRRALHGSVIRYLATSVVFRDGDMPARTLSGDDEVFARELAQTELLCLGAGGSFLVKALCQMASRFGIPSREELESFLQIGGGDPTLTNVLATALQLFWAGEYDAAVHLAVPKVEAAVRALLLEINEPVYRTQVGDATGVYPGLGVLLKLLLDNGFDPDRERFLRTMLLGEGANVRNLTAHGFTHDIDPLYAAAVLRALALLALIAPQSAVQRDTETVKSALANPIGTRLRRRWWQRVAAAAMSAWFELRRG